MRTAIFVVWDDSGGFYDHVQPPVAAKAVGATGSEPVDQPVGPCRIDHQTLSFDAYLKLIEDRFLGGIVEFEPTGWPGPTLREESRHLGDLAEDFDSTQDPDPAARAEPLAQRRRDSGRNRRSGCVCWPAWIRTKTN